MSEELNNLVDDILKEKLKLHYENEELEAQGKLIKELCKENERLNNIIKEARKLVKNECWGDNNSKCIDDLIYYKCDELLEILDKVEENK